MAAGHPAILDDNVAVRVESACMADQAGRRDEFGAGEVKAVGSYAVGISKGQPFAVSRRCRHLGADLAGGHVDDDGRLVCPWHGSAYDVSTGRMVRGPQGVFAKIPGLGWAFKSLTAVLPLGRGRVVERDGCLFVE
jgi:nitrite reductase/ring-hydroxylating ferredoxin subunit